MHGIIIYLLVNEGYIIVHLVGIPFNQSGRFFFRKHYKEHQDILTAIHDQD